MVHDNPEDKHTEYACFYNGKLLPQNPALPANEHDCCLCCYWKQTIKPPTYIPTPEGPWLTNENYEPNLDGCYCTCCPCWPDKSVEFEMTEGKLSFDGGQTFPADADNIGKWDHTLEHGNIEGQAGAYCFLTQLHGFRKGGPGGHWRCGAGNALQYEGGGAEYEDSCVIAANQVGIGPMVMPEEAGFNVATDCKKYGNENLYPEAWGHRGRICADGVKYESNRPALVTDNPGPPHVSFESEDCGGMGIISTLCCCKTGGGSVEEVALPDCYNRCPAGGGPYCPGHGIGGGGVWSHILPTWDGEDEWKNNYPPDNNYTCESHCFTYCLMPDPVWVQRFSIGAYGEWRGTNSDDSEHHWVQMVGFSDPTPASPCTHKTIPIHPHFGYEPPEDPGFGYPVKDNPATNYNLDEPYSRHIGEVSPMTRNNANIRSTSGHTRITYAKCGGGEPSAGGGKFHLKVAGEMVIHADCHTGMLPCYDLTSANCAPKQGFTDDDICPPCDKDDEHFPHNCCRGEAAGRAAVPDGVDNIHKGVIAQFWIQAFNPPRQIQAGQHTVCEPTHFYTLSWPDPNPPPRKDSLIGMSVHNIGIGWINPVGREEVVQLESGEWVTIYHPSL